MAGSSGGKPAIRTRVDRRHALVRRSCCTSSGLRWRKFSDSFLSRYQFLSRRAARECPLERSTLHASNRRRAAASKSVRNTMSYIVTTEVAQIGRGSQSLISRLRWRHSNGYDLGPGYQPLARSLQHYPLKFSMIPASQRKLRVPRY